MMLPLQDTGSSRRPLASVNLRLLVGCLALACVLLGMFYLIRWKRPHWLDRETVDVVALQELQTAKLALSPPAAGKDWPQWFGPERDGRAPDGVFRTDWNAAPPEILWTTPCGGGYSSLVLSENRLFTQDRLGDQERVLCVRADTGQPLWVYEYPANYADAGISYGAGPRATPLVRGQRLYCLGATGMLL